MNAVLGAAELLRRTRLAAPQAEYVEMISSAGAVLMNVLNDVLDLSKIEAGKFQILPEPTDLHALVRRCAGLWSPQAEAAGLIEGGLTKLGLDPAQIKYVIVTHGHGDHYGGATYLAQR